MLTIGKDSYITVEEADELIESHVGPHNALRQFWGVLDEIGKERYLRLAAEELENAVFTGRKSSSVQSLFFPRDGEKQVPGDIRLAQAYDALGMLNEEIKAASENCAKLYARFGVRLNGGEGDMGFSSPTETGASKKILSSRRAEELVKKYLRGGFRMR